MRNGKIYGLVSILGILLLLFQGAVRGNAAPSTLELVKVAEILHETPFAVAARPNANEIAVATPTGIQRLSLPDLHYIEYVFEQEIDSPYDVQWSPDGTKIAVGGGYYFESEPRIEIWDVAEQVLIKILTVPEHTFYDSLLWSPTGEYIAVNIGLIWNVDTGEVLADAVADVGHIYQVAWSPSGNTIAALTREKLLIWDVSTGMVQTELEISANGLDWSSAGLAIATHNGVMLWKETGVLSRLSEGDGVMSLVWSPDASKIAALERGGGWRVLVIEVASGESVAVITKGVSWNTTFDWLPDAQQLLVNDVNTSLNLWDINTQTLIAESETKGALANYGSANSLSIAPDGRAVAVVNSLGQVEVWDIDTKTMRYTVTASDMKWSPDGAWLAGVSGENELVVWDAATGHLLQRRQAELSSVYDVAWSPDSRWLAAIGSDFLLEIWEPQTGELINQIDLTQGEIGLITGTIEADLDWSPDGTQLATIRGGYLVRIWDVDSGLLVKTIQHELVQGAGQADNVRWSDDGQRLAVDSLEKQSDVPLRVKVFNLQSGDTVQFEANHYMNNRFVWLCGDIVLYADSGDLLAWDADTGELVGRFGGAYSDFVAISRTPAGNRIAAISNWEIVVFDVLCP